ncbi:hypothetical protein KVF89_15545 [Nocardioides carbamazepini]|uniref:hypothetical protein n=1 Tax=Nocardioides carbamazepini TaxID=2854259 RepID=UPI002149D603|nr:hypothetical protein [Nocardioides carbamazepini]MCR1783955.1 hypothetical protein [Nocardioides carbamazepini]
MSSPQPSIAVGGVLGDSDSKSLNWARAIGELSRQVEHAQAATDSPLRLSIEFHVGGRLASVDWSGVRTGRFNRRRAQLIVQAAVPPFSEEDERAVLLRLLVDAVDQAEAFAVRQGVADSLTEIRIIVEHVISQ